MAALGLMCRLPSLTPMNTDGLWQNNSAADPAATLRLQELEFQRLLEGVKRAAITNTVIGKEHTESDGSEAEESLLSGDESQSLEYPSDEGDSEVDPLDMDMHGDDQGSIDLGDGEGEGDVDNWTFF